MSDKPAWVGYGGVLLAAYYAGRPFTAPGATADWSDDPIFMAAKAAAERFRQILLRALWLPVQWGARVQEIDLPTGGRAVCGSVFELAAELRELDRIARTCGLPGWGRWGETDPEETCPSVLASYGWSIWTPVAEFATRERVPLLLDY